MLVAYGWGVCLIVVVYATLKYQSIIFAEWVSFVSNMVFVSIVVPVAQACECSAIVRQVVACCPSAYHMASPLLRDRA